jgi:hypothetical protein
VSGVATGTNASFAGSTGLGNVYSSGTKTVPGFPGGGAGGTQSGNVDEIANGANGAVRVIWGSGRAFPSTNTGDV